MGITFFPPRRRKIVSEVLPHVPAIWDAAWDATAEDSVTDESGVRQWRSRVNTRPFNQDSAGSRPAYTAGSHMSFADSTPKFLGPAGPFDWTGKSLILHFKVTIATASFALAAVGDTSLLGIAQSASGTTTLESGTVTGPIKIYKYGQLIATSGVESRGALHAALIAELGTYVTIEVADINAGGAVLHLLHAPTDGWTLDADLAFAGICDTLDAEVWRTFISSDLLYKTAPVIEVTSANDGSGAGTLRNALATAGPRVVRINIDGASDALGGQVQVTQDHCYIENVSDTWYLRRSRLRVAASWVTVRKVRSYAGGGAKGQAPGVRDSFAVGADSGFVHDVIVDECEFGLAPDELAGIYSDDGAGYVYFLRSIIAGGIACGHDEGEPHRLPFLIAAYSQPHTFIHLQEILFANGEFRLPMLNGGEQVNLYNCVTYDAGLNSWSRGAAGPLINARFNRIERGPNSTLGQQTSAVMHSSGTPTVYMEGNLTEDYLNPGVWLSNQTTNFWRCSASDSGPGGGTFTGNEISTTTPFTLYKGLPHDTAVPTRADLLPRIGAPMSNGLRHPAIAPLLTMIENDNPILLTSYHSALWAEGAYALTTVLPDTTNGFGYSWATPGTGLVKELGLRVVTRLDVAPDTTQRSIIDIQGRFRVVVQANGIMQVLVKRDATNTCADWASTSSVIGISGAGNFTDLRISYNGRKDGYDGSHYDGVGLTVTANGVVIPGTGNIDPTTIADGLQMVDLSRQTGVLIKYDGDLTTRWPFETKFFGLYPHELHANAGGELFEVGGVHCHPDLTGYPFILLHGAPALWNTWQPNRSTYAAPDVIYGSVS